MEEKDMCKTNYASWHDPVSQVWTGNEIEPEGTE